MDHIHHTLHHSLPSCLIHRYARSLHTTDRQIIDAMNNRGHKALAFICQHHCRLCQLQRGGQHISLTDPSADGFARVPGLAQCGAFPISVGQNAILLTGGIDSRAMAKAKGPQHLGHHVDTHSVREVVVISIAGLCDGHSQIHPLGMTRAADAERPVPVAAIIAGQSIPAWVGYLCVWGDETPGQCAQTDQRLDRGSGRVLPLNGAIEEWRIQ